MLGRLRILVAQGGGFRVEHSLFELGPLFLLVASLSGGLQKAWSCLA